MKCYILKARRSTIEDSALNGVNDEARDWNSACVLESNVGVLIQVEVIGYEAA